MWQKQCTQTLIGKHPVHGSDEAETLPAEVSKERTGFSTLERNKRKNIWTY